MRHNINRRMAAMDDQGYQSYLLGLDWERKHIESKDGVFTAWEERRLETISQIRGAEPGLQKILVDLDERQRQERDALLKQHSDFSIPEIEKRDRELEQRHDEERARYIREHQEAKDLQREIDEKQQLASQQERKLTG
jgi:hypothetical protein